MPLSCTSCSPASNAAIARGVVDLNTNPRLHGDHVHGVAGSEGSRPRIDVRVVILVATGSSGRDATELPGHLSGRIQAGSLPVNAAAHRTPDLIRSLRCHKGRGIRACRAAIFQQE